MTKLFCANIGITTPGSTYDGEFDTTNPVAWGFDRGGFIYRDASGNSIYNPATLAGGAGIPAATAARVMPIASSA